LTAVKLDDVMPQTPALTKPRLRGISHLAMFPIAVLAAIPLLFIGRTSTAVVSAVVFGTGVAAMFGVSGFYHVVTWTPRARARLARLDHATVYGLIAATYTPFGLLVLDGAWRVTVLAIVWTGALLAILMKLFWVAAPKWLSAAIGLGLGWAGVAAMPKIADVIGITGVLFLAAGGLLYTAGGIIYALKRPNLIPGVFGYHELFHAFVIVAVALQYVAVAVYVLPGR
jgi:hemolysin III